VRRGLCIVAESRGSLPRRGGGSEPLKVTPYNGGLFKNEVHHQLLGTRRISDRYLAPALDALAKQKDESGENRGPEILPAKSAS
jgi:hypothetical protein